MTVAEVQADSYRSSLRNKLVAEGFYLINAIEKYGSGFIRIRKALQDYPEVKFDIAEKFGGVMATFALSGEPPRTALVDGLNEGVSGGVSGGVNGPDDLRIIITDIPGLNTSELMVRSNKPKRTIERWLKQLKDQGHIEFRGASKTGGYHPKPNH